MRLLERNSSGEICLTEDFLDDKVPLYAILSHTWGTEEVSFKAMMDGTGRNKLGYDKIRFCGDQAWLDGLRFFWVDTCCIDKSNSAELQEAINSMFHWYRDAAKCYVYLADVPSPTFDTDTPSQPTWESAFGKSRWFTRGWTLQELIAPASVEFFSKEGTRLGNKKSLEQHIHNITGIPFKALRGSSLSEFSVSKRMAWAKKRKTTRKEDKAYSLLGIFNIYMPLIYGEGEENALKRLQEEIDKVLDNPELQRLASASRDCTVKIWDPATGQCVSTLTGHRSFIMSVAWSSDAQLASASRDNTVKIWDPATGQCISTLTGHSSSVRSVAWSYDAMRLASASLDSTVKIWDPATGQCISTLDDSSDWVMSLRGHDDHVNSVAWSHDATRLASTSEDRTVKIWDPATGQCVSTLRGHSDQVRSVAWSHNARLASASRDDTVKIWDPATGQCILTLRGHGSWVWSVAWSYDAMRLASASLDGTVKIWDPATGQCISTLDDHISFVYSVAWSHDA